MAPSSSISVFVLHHIRNYASENESAKLIGVYGTEEAAHEAIQRLRNLPGFRENPTLFDPAEDDVQSGFIVDEYELNRDHWEEGFIGEVS